jgi:hypothetical protein
LDADPPMTDEIPSGLRGPDKLSLAPEHLPVRSHERCHFDVSRH